MGGNAGAACQKRGNHKQLRNGLHRTLPIYMINVFYKELSGVATGNRSRPLRGMRRSIRKIAVAENASIAARKIIGARSLPVASRIRSDESSVGKEWCRTCRSRWSPYH